MRHYWLLQSLVYLSLIYSASLLHFYGPDRTVDFTYYLRPARASHAYDTVYRDRGMLSDGQTDGRSFNAWKMSSFWGDAGYYLLGAQGKAIPSPYRYRTLPPFLAGLIAKTGLRLEYAFLIINIVSVFVAAHLLAWWTRQAFGFSESVALLGGVLFLTMVGMTRTLAFPMLEPMSFLFAILMVVAAWSGNVILFAFSGVAGVMTKEILLVYGLAWGLNQEGWKRAWGLLPLVVFAVIRLALGGSLDVGLGHDLGSGQLPLDYIGRLSDLRQAATAVILTFLSFSFLWFGLVNLRREQFLLRSAVVIPLTTAATVLLSSRIERPLGVLFPVVIPLFLLFFKGRQLPRAG